MRYRQLYFLYFFFVYLCISLIILGNALPSTLFLYFINHIGKCINVNCIFDFLHLCFVYFINHIGKCVTVNCILYLCISLIISGNVLPSTVVLIFCICVFVHFINHIGKCNTVNCIFCIFVFVYVIYHIGKYNTVN